MPDQLARTLRSCTDLASVLARTLDRSLALAGAAHGNIQLMNWRSGFLEIAAQRGFEPPFLQFFARVCADDGSACAQALRRKRAVIIDDVEHDASFSPTCRTAVLDAGARAVCSLPFVSASGAFLGVLSAHFTRVHRPSNHELAVMTAAAQCATQAIIVQRAREKDAVATSLDMIAASKDLLRRVDQRLDAEVWWRRGTGLT